MHDSFEGAIHAEIYQNPKCPQLFSHKSFERQITYNQDREAKHITGKISRINNEES